MLTSNEQWGMARRMQIAVDCSDPERLAAFWSEVLGVSAPRPSGRTLGLVGVLRGWAHESGPTILFQPATRAEDDQESRPSGRLDPARRVDRPWDRTRGG